MLLFEVEKQTLRQLRASDPVVADSQGYLKAGFVFTSDCEFRGCCGIKVRPLSGRIA